MSTAEIITKLNLTPHPEGGFYRETYRCSDQLDNKSGKQRNISTSIYYLLENENKSHFHRIQSDELWYFHQGKPIEIVCIINDRIELILLGNNVTDEEIPQVCIPKNTWFAARVKGQSGFGLVSCSVAPGFDFEDFEMAKRNDLIKMYPNLSETIMEFTRA